MQSFTIISLVILSVCEVPILDAKKVVVVIPRHQIRRSPPSPLRHLMMHAKKYRFIENGYQGQKKSPQFHSPKNLHFVKNQYPDGGDDFDNGHEEVNNVVVPHGRGISHAVSFGKGYIPFQNYHDPRSTVQQNFNFEAIAQHQRYAPVASIVNLGQLRSSQVADTYSRNEGAELQKRAQDSEQFANNVKIEDSGRAAAQTSPGIVPTPSTSVKQPIILTDTILLGDYQRKIAELAKSWPVAFANPNNALPGLLNPAQNQKGYAVKEEVVDAPHDFRTMPIQASHNSQPAQQILPQPGIQQLLQLQQPAQQIVQQQPFHIIQQPAQQTLQNVLPQTQIPVNIAIPNYQAVLG